MIAGDRTDMRSVAIMAGRELKYQERRGDGPVLLRSASLNSVERAWPSFAEHPTIFDDNNVRNKIGQVLKRCDWVQRDFKAEEPTIRLIKTSGGAIEASVLITSARIEQIVLPSGSNPLNLVGKISVAALDLVFPPGARYQVRLDGRVISEDDFACPTSLDEGGNLRYRFRVDGIAVAGSGLVEATVHFQGRQRRITPLRPKLYSRGLLVRPRWGRRIDLDRRSYRTRFVGLRLGWCVQQQRFG